MLSPMMVERRWPTCISFAMLGEEKSTTTLDMAPKEHMNKRPLLHLVCMTWVLLGGAGGTRITSADPQQGTSEASAWDLLQPSQDHSQTDLGRTPTPREPSPSPSPTRDHSKYRWPAPRSPVPKPHPTYSALTTCWHGHLLSTSLPGGISKLPAVPNISPVAGWLCAYCCTFFLLPIAGGWTPLINKLLSCFDTKSFLKWTLIKPLQEKTNNECWGCRSASNHFLFPSPLDFCFHASSTRAHEVSLTKHFSVTGQQSCH